MFCLIDERKNLNVHNFYNTSDSVLRYFYLNEWGKNRDPAGLEAIKGAITNKNFNSIIDGHSGYFKSLCVAQRIKKSYSLLSLRTARNLKKYIDNSE